MNESTNGSMDSLPLTQHWLLQTPKPRYKRLGVTERVGSWVVDYSDPAIPNDRAHAVYLTIPVLPPMPRPPAAK